MASLRSMQQSPCSHCGGLVECSIEDETASKLAELVRGIRELSISTSAKTCLRSIVSKAYKVEFPPFSFGRNPAVTYVLKIGSFHTFPEMTFADGRFHADLIYGRLVTDEKDDNAPMTKGSKPLPHIVVNIGELFICNSEGCLGDVPFLVVADILSESKDIWVIDGGDHDDDDDIYEGQYHCNHCNQYEGEGFISRDAIDDSFNSMSGPLFEIAWLNLTWDELLDPTMPEDLRRARIQQGIAQTARCTKPMVQILELEDIEEMGAKLVDGGSK